MSVTVKFCGAARTVTGSCYLFQTAAGRFLVDCGLFQGSKTLKALNYGAFAFEPGTIDAVLLTHAHIDHSGLLPKLIRDGFRGSILATRGTIDLCSFMLPDSGSIQETEVATLNRRNAARGRGEVVPIYTQADAIAALQAFRAVEYNTWIDVISGIRARYWNAGHYWDPLPSSLNSLARERQEHRSGFCSPGTSGRTRSCYRPRPRRLQDLTMFFRNRLMEALIGRRRRPTRAASAWRRKCAMRTTPAALCSFPPLLSSVRRN